MPASMQPVDMQLPVVPNSGMTCTTWCRVVHHPEACALQPVQHGSRQAHEGVPQTRLQQ